MVKTFVYIFHAYLFILIYIKRYIDISDYASIIVVHLHFVGLFVLDAHNCMVLALGNKSGTLDISRYREGLHKISIGHSYAWLVGSESFYLTAQLDLGPVLWVIDNLNMLGNDEGDRAQKTQAEDE